MGYSMRLEHTLVSSINAPLPNHGKDTWMIASYSGSTHVGHQGIARPTTKPTPQNKIYYGTPPKRITIFRHPHKKRKMGKSSYIYHKQTDTQQYIHFRSHHPKNCIKSIPYPLARRIHTLITDKKNPKYTPKNYTQPYTGEDIQQH